MEQLVSNPVRSSVRNWFKTLIAEAVGEALTQQHKATLKPTYNITGTADAAELHRRINRQAAHISAARF